MLISCFAIKTFAENEQKQAQISYCYGVYEGLKTPTEVQKAKKILTSTPNPEQNIYSLLTSNDSYKEGKKEGKKQNKLQKKNNANA